MIRLAAHFVYFRKLHKMSFVEITDDGLFAGVFPLTEECAQTRFFSGTLILLPEELNPEVFETLLSLNGKMEDLHAFLSENGCSSWASPIEDDTPFSIYLFDGLYPPTKFGTYHGCCDGNVQ